MRRVLSILLREPYSGRYPPAVRLGCALMTDAFGCAHGLRKSGREPITPILIQLTFFSVGPMTPPLSRLADWRSRLLRDAQWSALRIPGPLLSLSGAEEKIVPGSIPQGLNQ